MVEDNRKSIKVHREDHDKLLQIKLIEGIPVCDTIKHLLEKKKLKI